MRTLPALVRRVSRAIQGTRSRRSGLGVAIGQDTLRVVAVRSDRVLWAAEGPIDSAQSLVWSVEDALGRLLSSAPSAGLLRQSVTVAVGPSRSQTRRLSGLPPSRDRAIIRQLVHANVQRFFLRNGVPLTATGVRVLDAETAIGAVIETPVIEAVIVACAKLGLRLKAVVPTTDALARDMVSPLATWHDGDVSVELLTSDGQLADVRRPIAAGVGANTNEAFPAPTALACLGGDAARFADAYGAAVADVHDSLAIRGAELHRSHHLPRWRLVAAGGIAAFAIIAALAAPRIAATSESRRAERRLATIGDSGVVAAGAMVDLRQVTAALDEVASFDAGRRSTTLLLGELTRVLPPDVFLITVRLDSSGGSLIALASRSSDVMAQLERLQWAGSAEIVGPVTRERVNAVERERLTVRFRWPGHRARSTTSLSRGQRG